jgi:hypothetical protein
MAVGKNIMVSVQQVHTELLNIEPPHGICVKFLKNGTSETQLHACFETYLMESFGILILF